MANDDDDDDDDDGDDVGTAVVVAVVHILLTCVECGRVCVCVVPARQDQARHKSIVIYFARDSDDDERLLLECICVSTDPMHVV